VISFAFTEDQTIARSAAAALAQAHARPGARAADEANAFPASLIERAWALGLVQTAAAGDAPEQPSVLNAIVIEEIAYGDATLAAALAAPLGFVRAIAGSGSPAQKRRHLPAFTGDAPRFATLAHLDAGWLPGLKQATRARKTVSGWRLDGAKTCVPLAARCDTFIVTGETDAGARAFIVPASARGLTVAQARGSLGLRALQMADVVLHDVFTLRLHENALTIVRRRHAWAAGLFQSLVLTADLRQCRENVNM
jgi:alkylation response protein AidB-like acyl-CoA dehydrogenase